MKNKSVEQMIRHQFHLDYGTNIDVICTHSIGSRYFFKVTWMNRAGELITMNIDLQCTETERLYPNLMSEL